MKEMKSTSRTALEATRKSQGSFGFGSVLLNVAKHIALLPKEEKHFVSLLAEQRVNKNEYLLREGDLCEYISYVSIGTLRAFYKDADEKESTIMFAISDWWITDMNCFINGMQTQIFIQAVEESTVLKLSKRHLDQLYLDVPKFERFFRILMQNSYIREQQRVLQRLSLTAEERYNNFIKKYPAIVQRVPQKQIASYLGITPEFLSSIRKSKPRKIS